jgi:hypothetical protein
MVLLVYTRAFCTTDGMASGLTICDVAVDSRVVVAEAGGVGTNGGYPALLLFLTSSVKHILSVVVGLCELKHEVSHEWT